MAKKAVVKKEKYAGHKGPIPGMKVETPYPNKIIKPDDIDYLGNELVKLSDIKSNIIPNVDP